MIPLGIRSNNPTNLLPGGWLGEVGINEKGFAVFDAMENGLRAAAKNLMAYEDKHGIDTVRGAITRWSTTDQDAYVAYVCAVCGLNADDKINLHDPDTLFWMLTAMGEMENGHDAFTSAVSDNQIDEGIRRALS